jgi:hypothetical protein
VYEISENANEASEVFGLSTGCRLPASAGIADCQFSDPEEGACLWPFGNGWMTLMGFSALLFEYGEATGIVEANDAADALGLNARARLSRDSPPDDEGGTARIVDLSAGWTFSSSSTSSPFSNSVNSGGGDVGGVLPWENLKDDGV